MLLSPMRRPRPPATPMGRRSWRTRRWWAGDAEPHIAQRGAV